MGFNDNEFLIGSFQRDTEGSDLVSPKLIKGPDTFLRLIKEIIKDKENLKVVLSGKRRGYLINNFEKEGIPYEYFEMVNLEELNKLYNVLDLYLVTSRIEGGPQAILECGISKTPILSTDVGVASEILDPASIFNENNFTKAKANPDFAYKNSLEFIIPKGMQKFNLMLKELYES
jgi:Glycosyltransferase